MIAMHKNVLRTIICVVLFSLLPSAGAYGQDAEYKGLKQRLEKHLYTLASDSLQGREAGTAGGHMASEYIAARFREIGLEPVTDSTYFQHFTAVWRRNRNVLGMIRGNDPRLKEEVVVIGAHFDHLGTEGSGTIYHGADDNASGVSALIETARLLKAGESGLRRTVIFAAFDAEEKGLWGSSHFVSTTGEHEDIVAMLNMDMVGWHSISGNLDVAGVAMYRDREVLLADIGIPEGLNVRYKNLDRMLMGDSDHSPFAKKGIPALYISTGLESPYHKPSDTADRIDYDGLALITEYVSDFAMVLARRDNVAASGRVALKHRPQRRVEAGIMASAGSSRYRVDVKKGDRSGTAWGAGVWMQLNFKFLALRPAVLYESDVVAWWPAGDGSYDSGRMRLGGITVPLDIMLKSNFESNLYGYLLAGGYYKGILTSSGGEYRPGRELSRNEWGLRWGFGFNIYALMMEFSWNYGLTPTLDYDGGPDLRNRNFRFTLGYRF